MKRDLYCPKCNVLMEKKTAKKGRFEGKQFWGCTNFPKCWKKKVYKEGDDKLHWNEVVNNSRMATMSEEEFDADEAEIERQADLEYERNYGDNEDYLWEAPEGYQG